MKKIALIGALLLSSCTGGSQSASLLSPEDTLNDEPIRIGYIGPLTGDAASFGTDTVNGARMAVDHINETGGVHGRPVSLIAEDGRCNATDAVSAAEKLMNIDKVVGVIGGSCSSETLAASPVAEKANVVMISPLSSSPDITHAGDFVFRVYPSDALKGMALSQYFASKEFSRIAIVSENTDFCLGVHTSIENDLQDGAKFVFDEVVEPGTKDYQTLFTRMREAEFDIFIANGQSPTTIAAMAEQMRELGMQQPIVSTDAADSITLGHIAKDAVEGLRALSVPSLTEENDRGGAFVRKYKEKHGNPKVGYFFAALSYEATMILLEAIREHGVDAEELRDALYALEGHDGSIGTISFDAYGDVHGIPFALKEFQNGELVEVQRISVE